MKRFLNKKVVTIGLAAGLTLGAAGAAFAYFTTSGNGTGVTTAGTAGGVTLHATIDGNIVPGDGGQAVHFTADNANATSAFISTISFVSVDSSNSACSTLLDTTLPNEFSMGQVTANQTVAGNSSGVAITTPGLLKWADSLTVDQTACAGKPLTLTVSTP